MGELISLLFYIYELYLMFAQNTLKICLVGFVLAFFASAPNTRLVAQEKIYPNTFPLSCVQLLDGPFKYACDLNVDVLLQYDTDRLLAPFLKQAGLPLKGELFPNWEGLDGHVGGHYLSALAIHYAATANKECHNRMEYVISELKRCQQAHGNGYLGGVPNGMHVWNELQKGNVGVVWGYWVPWYNLHKTYAGLRDAYIYGGSKEARQMFLDLCDWGLTIIAPLSDGQMEQMLEQEFGGMNEVYADAYHLTGDLKYLEAAKRFSHRWLLDSMVAGVDNLDNKHANTQVPKAVGYQRVAEMCELAGQTEDAARFRKAAEFFWHTVANTRSLALGGNSRREHFAAASDCLSYVEDREGPESCNTNNMLKLTEGLFRIRPEASYADFYERALLNHILSTQHPEHGGYVYFTPARPAHYRVYSAPNSAMWCCVGTGMENHGKYGEFIYSHSSDDLYVNLFIASRLEWKEKGIRLTQQTRFPDEEQTRLTLSMKKSAKARILVRRPSWCKEGGMKVTCGGQEYTQVDASSGYIAIDRKWRDGDVIEIQTPMKVTVEELPNVPDYIAIMRGPVLLGARMGAEGLHGLVADDGRWAHIAHGPLVSLFDTPFIIGERADIRRRLEQMQPVPGKSMCYTVPGLFRAADQSQSTKYADLQLEPFFRIHDSRYMMYWLSMTEAQYAAFVRAARQKEEMKLQLDSRTVDAVNAGEQQPEADHKMKQQNTRTGNYLGELWREAYDGGRFHYLLATRGEEKLSLMVRYCCNNRPQDRTFDILIDGKLLKTITPTEHWKENEMVNLTLPIPVSMLQDKEYLTVEFRSPSFGITTSISQVRIIK